MLSIKSITDEKKRRPVAPPWTREVFARLSTGRISMEYLQAVKVRPVNDLIKSAKSHFERKGYGVRAVKDGSKIIGYELFEY